MTTSLDIKSIISVRCYQKSVVVARITLWLLSWCTRCYIWRVLGTYSRVRVYLPNPLWSTLSMREVAKSKYISAAAQNGRKPKAAVTRCPTWKRKRKFRYSRAQLTRASGNREEAKNPIYAEPKKWSGLLAERVPTASNCRIRRWKRNTLAAVYIAIARSNRWWCLADDKNVMQPRLMLATRDYTPGKVQSCSEICSRCSCWSRLLKWS